LQVVAASGDTLLSTYHLPNCSNNIRTLSTDSLHRRQNAIHMSSRSRFRLSLTRSLLFSLPSQPRSTRASHPISCFPQTSVAQVCKWSAFLCNMERCATPMLTISVSRSAWCPPVKRLPCCTSLFFAWSSSTRCVELAR
jgi:hypothetical protein